MVALRTRPTGALSGPFWLSAFCVAFMPTSIGYQDLAAFFARQPRVSDRWHDHRIASPFGTIHAATFSFSRPIGTAMPEPFGAQPVNFDPRSLNVKTWSVDASPMAHAALQIEYPTVNRRLKGDRMLLPEPAPASSQPESLPQAQPINAPQPARPPAPVMAPRPKDAEQREPAPAAAQPEAAPDLTAALPAAEEYGHQLTAAVPPSSTAQDGPDNARDAEAEDDLALADKPPEIPAPGESDPPEAQSPFASLSVLDEDPAERSTQLYFGVAAMGSRSGLERWQPGAEPVLVPPSVDPDIKLSALQAPRDAGAGGETVAGKNDVSLLRSPADRLGLAGKPRARAEKCLADAVYFEARGEPLRGQMAVAQVVMNRVFSGFYPDNVCGVVYQNANRHLACQFTFACEGKDLSRIDEPDMWAQAKRIAKDTLDGKIWLADVGHATHYHAYWVHPSWVHEMKKMYKLGVHTFYRPRAWGDGSDAPNWAPIAAKPAGAAEIPAAAKASAAGMKSPDATVKIPEAAASPAEVTGSKTARTAKL
jgi:hypothetical protein